MSITRPRVRWKRGPLRIVIAAGAVLALGAAGMAVASAATTPPSQFTVVNGTIRTAHGTPVPASGTEAALWSATSTATTTISGSGRVVIGAIGYNCQGWPTIQVTVDGAVAGTATITSNTDYGAYTVGSASVAAGSHKVVISFTNDFRVDGGCDRNVAIGSAKMDNKPVGFVHPGIAVDKARLDTIKANLGKEPYASAYALLQSAQINGTKYSSLNWKPSAVDSVNCPTAGGEAYLKAHPELPQEQGCDELEQDPVAAFTQALMWYLTGNPAYAQKSIEIMNAWSGKLTKILFDDYKTPDGAIVYGNGKLMAAWTGETMTRAAELIRYTYTPAAGKTAFNVAKFSSMLTNVVLPLTVDNWVDCCANWHLSTADATINIGVFTDNQTVYKGGIADWKAQVPAAYYLKSDVSKFPGYPIPPPNSNYDKPGATAEKLAGYWKNPTAYVDGLGAETCRDLSHTTMGIEALSYSAETARIQGTDDLWKAQETRIYKAMEYNASLINSMVAGILRPSNSKCTTDLKDGGLLYKLGWEAAYNHYSKLGYSLPNTKALVARDRPTNAVLLETYGTLLFGEPL